MDPLTLAELLCARVCHDLSGPVGAAAAGAELLEDLAEQSDGETLALVAVSAGGAASRLKFFRAALGPAARAPQPAATLRDLIEGYFKTLVSAASPGLVLDWRAAAPAFDGESARLLLNIVLLAKDALPRGGRITVEATDGLPVITALAEPAGPTDQAKAVRNGEAKTVLSDEAKAVLIDHQPPAGPRGAQAYFTRLLAEKLTTGIEISVTPAGLTLTTGRRVSPPDDGRSRPDG